ncbi:class I adenylate-forming enzyme family protein [Sphingomonas segetis]|jgi:acyl-CoA synthetase (AMP-forming)/AMP-acid ligase II|uniref:class I adenylate-forming enzyme family protein n=1 Tax=Sphingomonas segetis TaxID=1104779 RepID=UPI0012D2E988|nr:class I adenylate-forming enzyme family protein [Sphingomonas segetis]
MPSALDRRFDEELARVIGPGGRLVIGRDDLGRAIVENLPATLPQFFRTFCALNADNEALVAGAERFTFADLDALSERVARGFAARGITKGDRVGIAMRNCPSSVLAYMGLLKAGAVATLLNGWWEPAEMEHAIRLTEPKLIIADAPRAKRIAERCSDCDVLGVAIDQPVGQALAELLAADEAIELPDVGPKDEATILFTSGSTGLCKGALSTHRAVVTGTYIYATGLIVLLGLLTQEGRAPATPPRTLLSVPLFHVTGEVPVMLNSFVVGRCMVIMPKWDAAEALRLIEKEKITYFVGVPTMSLELMTHPDRHKYDLSSLKDITAGGAPRPVSHVERLRDAFPHAQPALGYGLTETNAVGALNFWSNYAQKPGSTGRAAPFVELAILGDGDRRLPAGEIGEIAIRSAADIKGYWRNPEATAALFTPDRFVRTGDVGYLDEDGYLFIVDRKKEIIIRGGENISAAEVEAEFYACPAVAEVSVFGAPDERLGEVPVAVVLANDGRKLGEEDLRAFLDGRLAKFKIPARIIFADAPLPKLGTGKIDRRALKAQFAH